MSGARWLREAPSDDEQIMLEAMREVDAITPSVPPMAPPPAYKPGSVLPYRTTADQMVIVDGFKPCPRVRFELFGVDALEVA